VRTGIARRVKTRREKAGSVKQPVKQRQENEDCEAAKQIAAHSARGGAPEGKGNGNYRHGGRTKEMIKVWKLIKLLR
jgi:hypothetical protein